MKQIPLVDLKAQYSTIKEEINIAISKVLEDQALIGGKYVNRFEEQWAVYCNTKYCVGVSSGTTALETALRALDLPYGQYVLTQSNTFVATIEAILNVGLKPLVIDVNESGLLDPEKIIAFVNSNRWLIGCILPVHLYGQVFDTKYLRENLSPNVKIIEDACQAHGLSNFNYSDAACFSFYPGKNLGAIGDAGAIITNNERISEYCKKYINHGIGDNKYVHEMIATNYRMSGINGSVLSAKLIHLDTWLEKRKNIKLSYNEKLWKYCVSKERSYDHLYVVRIPNRDKILKIFHDNNIFAGVHYPIPIHKQDAFKDKILKVEYLKTTEGLSSEILSLPIYPELTIEDVEKIVSIFVEEVEK